ncbi:molybdopterin-guanine dinucleotide biosynthesis protein B [Bacillus sp. BRMEA1]|uniref:molybdopterin-guanine dinucleotide biosynthesis protein B n=1 Tax=Neobacillus endophyticus TaxID=2738405 RepID=UPI00156643FA|nr:molybdopterin-guanine dinucleotide biosynthesis protein B [Neobacillus endophyticus]NRD78411.1 molybdopterin-guanine dinucleotide biosynthesis protein B [Neobacillus endophyticus]
MALVRPTILQVVGYQNSGKTTMIVKLIHVLNGAGFKTVTIKHHGHGGKPSAVEQKDSTRHLSAGAAASIVEGAGSLILQANSNSFSLEEQIKLISTLNPDVILIEGHKQADYPKLLILKEKEDLSLLDHLTNVRGILYWDGLKTYLTHVEIPVFSVDDHTFEHNCVEWLKDL